MGAKLFRKCLAVTIILLFIGVAIAPSINSYSVEDELVEFDVEFSGLDKNHSVKLTSQQTQEFYDTFDNMRNQMSNAKNREETNDIFKDTIYKLDELGMLGDVSVSAALDLVIKQEHNEKFTTMINNLSEINPNLLDSGNYLCSLAGNTDYMYFSTTSLRVLNIFLIIELLILYGLAPSLINIFVKAYTFFNNLIDKILDTFPTIYLIANLYRFIIETIWSTAPWLLIPLLILMSIPSTIIQALYTTSLVMLNLPSTLIYLYKFPIGFLWNLPGRKLVHHPIMYGNDVEGPSSGWVESVGINGNKSWNGSFWGQLPLIPHFFLDTVPDIDITYFYPGVMGFRGIEMTIDENGYYYMGNALWVNLGTEKPDNPWIP
ncbi:hypothetical protein MBGDF03_00638 [Thermoplasmatales archaeon SCGC AB-540-F20]|nr:hypothetical protein MBGDF03_00638 [Thermoplasmatales archaeon SCGC AB-540-F20]